MTYKISTWPSNDIEALQKELEAVKAELEAERNAAWLSQAHWLCAHIGIKPGHIEDRMHDLIVAVCELQKELETERCLSFRNQVAECGRERDELAAMLRKAEDFIVGPTAWTDEQVDSFIEEVSATLAKVGAHKMEQGDK